MKNFFKILMLFIFVSSCDYKPIFSSENSSFAISDFKLINENYLGKRIKKSFKNYSDFSKKKVFKVELGVDKNKEITSKDARGNISTFRINIICDFKIYQNQKLLKSKKINQSFLYNNSKNKFDLKKYESQIEENLLNKVVEELLLELYSA